MGVYAEYIGLGYNCEVAYEIRRAGQTRAQFFDWASTPVDTISQIIEARFEGAREDIEDDTDGMVRDKRFFHRFHGPHSAEKVDHLSRRFLTPIGRRCYILKADYVSPGQIVRLMDAIDDINRDYALVVVRTEIAQNLTCIETGDVRLQTRTLRRFAPLDDASDSHRVSWEAIWSEFQLAASDIGASMHLVDPMSVDLAA